MKAIILCAGYATRLYPLTENTPKPLLEVKGKPLLNYTIEKLEGIDSLDEIFIVTNNKFYPHFSSWVKGVNSSKKIKVLNDGTFSNEDRLGGLGDLWFVMQKENIDDDLMVLVGDTYSDYDLKSFVDFFNEKKANVLGLYDIKDLSKSRNFGILELEEGKIKSFEEKPENPKSTLISTGTYIYSKEELNKIAEYMKTDLPKEGPGYLIPYFLKLQDVHGFVFDGFWHDIGTKEAYEEVRR